MAFKSPEDEFKYTHIDIWHISQPLQPPDVERYPLLVPQNKNDCKLTPID